MKMVESIRSFIAISLPAEIQSALDEFILKQGISQNNGFRPVKSGNIHLTLKFLGDATPGQIKSVTACLNEIVRTQNIFSIVLKGVGAFPNWNLPRVIWAGMSAPVELESLYQRIDRETIDLGFPSENRKFSPHLTLSRVNSSMNDPRFARVVSSLRALSPAPFFGEMQADRVDLYRSILQPGGSVYSVISRHPFLGSIDV
jgi:2'-5' RNA ligase